MLGHFAERAQAVLVGANTAEKIADETDETGRTSAASALRAAHDLRQISRAIALLVGSGHVQEAAGIAADIVGPEAGAGDPESTAGACAEIGAPGRDRAEICADWWAAAACLLERIRSFEPRWAVLPLVSCAIQIRCCADVTTRHAARGGGGSDGAVASMPVCRVRVRAVEWPRRDDGTLQLGGRRRWKRCWRRLGTCAEAAIIWHPLMSIN